MLFIEDFLNLVKTSTQNPFFESKIDEIYPNPKYFFHFEIFFSIIFHNQISKSKNVTTFLICDVKNVAGFSTKISTIFPQGFPQDFHKTSIK